jgi:hypothetical protein
MHQKIVLHHHTASEFSIPDEKYPPLISAFQQRDIEVLIP